MPSTGKQPKARGNTRPQSKPRMPRGTSGAKGGKMTGKLTSPKGYRRGYS